MSHQLSLRFPPLKEKLETYRRRVEYGGTGVTGRDE